MKLSLEFPSLKRMDSYRSLVQEFDSLAEKPVPYTLAYDHADGNALLERFDSEIQGRFAEEIK